MLLDHHYHSAPDLLLRLRRRVRQRLRLQQWLRLQQRLRLLSIDTSYTKRTALTLVGVWVGNLFGSRYKSRAELTGGIILILIGVKILLEHLGVLG